MGVAPPARAPGLPTQGVPEEPGMEVAAHRAQPIHAFASPGLLGVDPRWSPECPRTMRGSRCIGFCKRSTTRSAKRETPTIDPTRVASERRPRAPTEYAHTHTHTHTHTHLSLIHISEPTRQAEISYAVFCLKKKINFITLPVPSYLH